MKDNEYDFKMEWPDECKDCENVPPATPEEMEGIMRAIAPALRRNRIIHRTRIENSANIDSPQNPASGSNNRYNSGEC